MNDTTQGKGRWLALGFTGSGAVRLMAVFLILTPHLLRGTAAVAADASSSAAASQQARAESVAALLVEGWKHRVWSLYPMEKLKADAPLASRVMAQSVGMKIARGGSDLCGIVLRSEVPLRKVRVVSAELRSSSGAVLAAEQVTAQRMAYVHVDEPSGSRIRQPMPYETGTGAFPDPLLRGDAQARPHQNVQFLVRVRVPRDARPGVYEGVLRLEYQRELWMPADREAYDPVRLRVEVRAFALPEVSPLMNTTVASPTALPEWLRNAGVLGDLRRQIAEHGQTPDPLPSPLVRVDREGALTVDSSAWEEAAAGLLDARHAPHVFLPVWSGEKSGEMQGLYFLWHFPAVCKQRWFGALICNEQGELTAEFRGRFGAYLRHMHGVVERRGWKGRVLVSTMDEAYTAHLSDKTFDTPENNYRVIGNFVRFLRETAPGFRTFATADPAPGLNGLIDHWCLRNLDHAAAARERAEKFGEEVTFCDNYRTFIDYPAVSARSLGWLAWKIGARGWLTFESMGEVARTWEGPVFVYPQFSGGTMWGMGQLFYPDIQGSGAMVGSLRWELMREGAEDYEHLWTLREVLGRVPVAKRSGPLFKEATQILKGAALEMVGGSGDAETTGGKVQPSVQDNLVAHRLRLRMADLIEALSEP